MGVFFAILVGYLIGSIPTALIIAKRYHIDIRQHGSGNIGGTNAFRVLGKKAGLTVTIADIIKGMLPTWFALFYGEETLAIVVGISAIIGHSFSVFVNFKGGKSVATSAGVMLVLSPLALLIGIITFMIVLFTTKYVSLSSMLAAFIVVLSIWFIEDSVMIQIVTVFFASFIIFRHHSNIKRLMKGEENKVFQKKD